ncbi:MAG: VCBS repeat-containing protein [Acidobacteria bacterium]|nr:VCBS repeat-containing protein [Acidobacteriota bacterium]
MRLSPDPQSSGISLLVLSLTFSFAIARYLFFDTSPVSAQSEACRLPSFRQIDHKLEPQNRYSNDPIAPALACGDLNQDGLPELVVAPAVTSDLPLLTNLRNGAFRVGYFLDVPYRDTVIGDFNSDGRPDIAGLTIFDTVTTLLGDGNGSFLPPNAAGEGRGTSVRRYATTLRATDFNRDGKLDLAVVSTLGNSVSILIGKGTGNFLDPINYEVQQNPHSLAVGDFNGDGASDVATANEYSETVSVLLNDGSGGFRLSHFAAGALPQKVVTGDFNRDGKSDLAIVNRGYNSVTVLRNDGAGSFAFAGRWDLPFTSGPIAVADFNRDGKDDLIIGHQYEGTLTLFLGDGNGSFCSQSRLQIGAASCCPVMDLCAIDVNSDGNVDVLAASESTVSVLLNEAATTPNAAPSITPISGVMAAGSISLTATIATVSDTETPAGSLQVEVTALPPAMTLSDLTNNNGTIRATFVLGCGALIGEQTIGLKVTDAGGLSASTTLKITVAPNSAPILGAYPDVVLGSGNATVSPTAKPSDNGSITSLTAVAQGYSGQLSVNADGVVTITNNGNAGRYLAVITATDNCGAPKIASFNFTIPSTPNVCSAIGFKEAVSVDAGTSPQALASGDVNGDGLPDVVAANRDSNKVTVLLGASEGGVRSLRTAFSYDVGANPRAVTIKDFDRDGRLDLAVVNRGADTVTILHGNGDGSFAVTGSYDCGNKPFSIAVGDFNRDGKADLVIVNDGIGSLAILDGNGDGSFGPPRYLYAGNSPQPALVADLNKDGKDDLVVANYSTNQVTTLLGYGDGSFENPRTFDAGPGWAPSPIALGDLNNDGNLDLVVGKTGFSQISVLLGFGNGSFGFYTAFLGGLEPQSLVVADFDEDGKLDVAVGNYQSNSVTVFQGNGTGNYDTLKGVYFNVGLRPLSLLSGDFNGDNKPDLVIANSGASSLSLLLNGCGER